MGRRKRKAVKKIEIFKPVHNYGLEEYFGYLVKFTHKETGEIAYELYGSWSKDTFSYHLLSSQFKNCSPKNWTAIILQSYESRSAADVNAEQMKNFVVEISRDTEWQCEFSITPIDKETWTDNFIWDPLFPEEEEEDSEA